MASLVTDGGLDNATAAWTNYATRARYVAWGTGTGQGVTATDLATAAGEARTAGTSSQQTTTTRNDTYRVTGTITATSGHAITEVGVFTATSGTNLAIYGDFSAINLSALDSIAFTVDVVLDQA